MKKLILCCFVFLLLCFSVLGCGSGGGGGSTIETTSAIPPDSIADGLVQNNARSAVEENNATEFADLFEESNQTDAQTNFSQMTTEKRNQLAQALAQAEPIYQSPDGNLRRYEFTVEIDGQPIKFPIDLRKDANGNWRIANL